MNKKGFTLIEIIVAIVLMISISTITVITMNKFNNNEEGKILEKNLSNFNNALEIYLSSNPELIDNVNENVNAAVVSLEVLKNEGLIRDDLDIDYKNNYYTLANAVLLNDEEDKDVACKNQIELKTFASWKIDDKSSEVIYICPKENSKDETDLELEERIKRLETIISSSNLGSKNYVKFAVEHNENKTVTWGKNDLWRIVSNNTNGIKIMYDNPVEHYFNYELMDDFKNKLLKVYTSSDCYDGGIINNSGELSILKLSEGVMSFSGNYAYRNSSGIYFESLLSTEYTARVYYVYNDIVYGNLSKMDFYFGTYQDKDKYQSIYSINTCSDGIKQEKKYRMGVTHSIAVRTPLGKINEHLFYSGYLKPEYLKEIHEKNDINYYDIDKLDAQYAYQLSGLFNINYYSVFNYKTTDAKSIKNMLYSQVNKNIVNSIVPSDYQYVYNYNEDGDEVFKTNHLYQDLIGTISLDEAKEINTQDPNTLIGKNIMIGSSNSLGTGNNVEIVRIDSTRPKITDTMFNRIDKYDMYYVNRNDFYPTVLIDKKYQLMLNINEYPDTYRNSCGDNELGTKDCPYLIKIGNYYSNGEHI